MAEVLLVDGASRPVLLIHSDADTRTALAAVLAERGYTVRVAGIDQPPAPNGEQLVITGLNGDGGDPDAALRWVGELRERYAAPVLVVTAWPDVSEDPALVGSVAGLMRAPVDIDELLERVDTLLA